MRPRRISLRALGTVWSLGAFAAGLAAAWMWFASQMWWQDYQTRAFVTGFNLFETLQSGAPAPEGVTVTALSEADSQRADMGAIVRVSDLPQPAYVTNVSIRDTVAGPFNGDVLTLAVVSGALRYNVSEIVSGEGQTRAQKLGNVTRLLATYCSAPTLLAHMGDGAWKRIDGNAVWGCAAKPNDYRLVAVIFGVISVGVLFTLVSNTSALFSAFASALRGRRRLGGPESYSTEGPDELQEIVAAVNSYLESEREQLSKRAVVLSGVSHDLGTPATRLRLRTALIEDSALREKLEGDIDRMTDMIESVLTYTRSELNLEEPRQISLTALVESLVADYQDVGQPVSYEHADPAVIEGGGSVFMSRRGHSAVPEQQRILAVARPMSLQRAITNLIDNALKFGRRATVSLRATSDRAVILVEDEGSEYSPEDIEALIAPFKRGDNTRSVGGFGLGLTIVATVAEQHGGALHFEQGRKGLRARFEIHRL